MNNTDLAPLAALPASLGVQPLNWQPPALSEEENIISFSMPYFMQQQTQTNWCWSAVATSVGLYLKSGICKWSQCDTANAILGLRECCASPCPSACNVIYNLADPLTYTKSLVKWYFGTSSKAELVQEVNKIQPVCTRIAWKTGGGHFNAVAGYVYLAIINGHKNSDFQGIVIGIQDPLFGSTYIKYDAYPELYQDGGTWTTTYLTQKNAC